MSVNEDWDVEQHKVEYESDEHWELRRNFLLSHKDKFSEDALVCLAQVFVNVELLGCRYRYQSCLCFTVISNKLLLYVCLFRVEYITV